MALQEIKQSVESILSNLPKKKRVGIIGSTSFYSKQGPPICKEIGKTLAQREDIILLTGGMTGAPEAVGREFHQTRLNAKLESHVYHILPVTEKKWDYGTTLLYGRSFEHRREILGRLCAVFLVIEGGPGTAHEAQVAKDSGAILIPIPCTGGVASGMFGAPHMPMPPSVQEGDWELLGDVKADPQQIAKTIDRILNEVLSTVKL